MNLRRFLTLGALQPVAPGIVADKAANFGLIAMMANLNAYAQSIATVVTAGTNSTLTAAQALAGVLRLTSGASGGFTITLPSTAALFNALGGQLIPTDGTFSKRISIVNDAVAQTGTLTIGDASTTLTGTMTIATSTTRSFLLTVTGATTITIQNIGTATL